MEVFIRQLDDVWHDGTFRRRRRGMAGPSNTNPGANARRNQAKTLDNYKTITKWSCSPADVPAVGLAVLLIVLWVLNLTALHFASQPAVETSVAWEPRV